MLQLLPKLLEEAARVTAEWHAHHSPRCTPVVVGLIACAPALLRSPGIGVGKQPAAGMFNRLHAIAAAAALMRPAGIPSSLDARAPVVSGGPAAAEAVHAECHAVWHPPIEYLLDCLAECQGIPCPLSATAA